MLSSQNKTIDIGSILRIAYERQVKHVDALVKTNQLNHAYCIIGVPDGAQEIFASHWISLLVKTSQAHPDVLHIGQHVGSTLRLEEVQRTHSHLHAKPVLSAYRIAIIHGAERLTIQASNALLKVIEEPPKNVLIFFTTAYPELLPRTILSRMQRIRLPYLSHATISTILESTGVEKSRHAPIAHTSAGRLGKLYEHVAETAQIQEWEEDVRWWVETIVAPIAERDARVTNRFLNNTKKEESAQAVPEALAIVEVIFHDLLLLHTNQSTMTQLHMVQNELEGLISVYSIEDVISRLYMVQSLRQYVGHNVNKKLLFHYLISAL